MKKFALIVAIVFQGCTSVTVQPIAPGVAINQVCIQVNPKVIVKDFLPVLQKRLSYHGLTNQAFNPDDKILPECEFVMTYSARQSWDFVTYLSQANLWLYKEGRPVASAEYHLVGKGGLSLYKWQGVESKMNPVIDELIGKAAGTD